MLPHSARRLRTLFGTLPFAGLVFGAVAFCTACPGPTLTPDGGRPLDAGTVDAPLDAGLGGDAGTFDAGDPAPIVCGALPAGVTEGHQGAVNDTATSPARSLVLMGGSVEVDSAARAFVEAAAGGDVLVLRASGSVDSYTPWFFEELGADPAPASAATLRIDVPSAAAEPAVRCRVSAAEALWLAGGDQWDYLGQWPASLHESLTELATRGVAVGGTSAGAMVLGQAAFAAEFGGVTSAEALANPLAADVSLRTPIFFQPELEAAIVDTHFSERDREGRLLAFLARAREALGGPVIGIGLDERAALTIKDGAFSVQTGAGDRVVFLYFLDEEAVLTAGSPLQIDQVGRVQLNAGASGAWPPDREALSVTLLTVQAGVVSPL